MESLAILVAILLLLALLCGPIAIALTKVKTESASINFFRRVFHGFFVAISLWIGMIFFFNPDLPFAVHFIGLYGLAMGFVATSREYFPEVRIIAPLLTKFGINRKVTGRGNDRAGNDSPSASQHGPVMKWRRNGRTGGNDGHGPEGQH